MPVQFAFVDATTCTARRPTGLSRGTTTTSSRRARRHRRADERGRRPDHRQDEGVAGRPELHLAAPSHSVPEEMTARLTESNIRLFHQQHPDGNGNDGRRHRSRTERRPVGRDRGGRPGDTDARLAVNGFVTDLPPDERRLIRDATGTFQEADVRFCDGAWGSSECNDSLGTVGEIGLVASNGCWASRRRCPRFRAAERSDRCVYANRDVGGQLSLDAGKTFPVRGAYAGRAPRALRSSGRQYEQQRVRRDTTGVVGAFRDGPLRQRYAPLRPRREPAGADERRQVRAVRHARTGPRARRSGTRRRTPSPSAASYQLFGAQSIFDAKFAYEGNTANNILQRQWARRVGRHDAGMPSKATIDVHGGADR